MKNTLITVIFFYLLLTGFSGGNAGSIEDFKLKNIDGSMLSLKNFEDAKGFIIVFTSNGCPFAKLYPKRLNEMNMKYMPLGVPLIAINSIDTLQFEENSFTEMVRTAKEENFNFSYLSDPDQLAAKNFGAKKTPHAFVIWKENDNWIIKYNGAIDDNAAEPDKATNKYVMNAVNELLNGEEVKIKETKSIGCSIMYKK